MNVLKRKKQKNMEENPLQKDQWEKPGKKRRANRQILQITYIFVGLFLALIGYIIHFVAIDSKEVITDSHNLRLQELEKTVVRGKIISSDGQVLAQTITENGEEVRDYPYGRMFAHVVGYNDKGKSGLESKCNFDLLTSNANIFSQITSNLSGQKSIGDNVYTTLDTKVQKAAYNALQGQKGAVVAMDPESGKIYAMVSKPDFRPGLVKENWQELNESESSLLLNRATQGLYPPGSTFKVVTALEYMREHEDDYQDFRYTCNGSTQVGDLTIHCYGGAVHGTVDLEEAMEKSCNTAFVHMAQSLNKGKFSELAKDLMFDSRVPINLLANKSRFSFNKNSGINELAHTAIGQGETLITPLQNAMVMCAIANNGVMMQPYLLNQVKNIDGGVIKETKTKEISNPLTETECTKLKKMLRKVITQGTGTRAYSSQYLVYGKTGSAEYNSAKDSHAWFIGCAEKSGKKIVVSVLVEDGDSGGRVAAPVADKVFHAFFD
ncbi:peptidoglycan glycosyltransferase [Anaerostipes sp. 494a]|uniref:peptidoglycan D,D-transpeptidase FtsI family protein n=1 Tax=Anaerostipes sp. 494a TaxID=1261636 RepID=UPI0009512696|nr:penicillin-binding transpeptidase domain-containing protein [Anaerostipes sp. 494a]OLR58735.1 peptidoglycan glycosyltransferase [Anaerostipes sp. 494a]